MQHCLDKGQSQSSTRDQSTCPRPRQGSRGGGFGSIVAHGAGDAGEVEIHHARLRSRGLAEAAPVDPPFLSGVSGIIQEDLRDLLELRLHCALVPLFDGVAHVVVARVRSGAVWHRDHLCIADVRELDEVAPALTEFLIRTQKGWDLAHRPEV